MKTTILGLLAFFLMSCSEIKAQDESILEIAIANHDSLNSWENTKLQLHIQEPRISSPQRYSILKLDNATGTFELSRNRDQYISKHMIDKNGNSQVLLDGKVELDTALISKYRLDPARNIGYKNFYQLLYGLPMSLNNSLEKIIGTSEDVFNYEECYKVKTELKEPVISKFWNIYVSKSSMMIKGIDIVSPDNPNGGERIYFDGMITVNGIKIPRIRHWYSLKDNAYLGSDLIILELVE